MRKVLRKSCQRESFRNFFPLFSRKIFQKSGYRILLGIFGVACLISLYVKDLFLFAWMVLVFVIPFLLPSRLEEEIYNLNFGTLKHLGSTVFLVLFYYCWRKRHRGWWVEVLCVFAFYTSIGLGMIVLAPA